MKNTVFIMLFLVVCISFGNAQVDLNKYKYIIVPNKYDFFKEADKYQLNSLTKFLFDKYGFKAIMDNEKLPKELGANPCLALRSNVLDSSGLFRTKLVVELRDCNNELIFSSREGVTREKEYSKAFNLALRDAFVSFKSIDYEYQPGPEEDTPVETTDETNLAEVEKLKEEIKALKEEKALMVNKETEPVVAIKQEVVEESVPVAVINEKVKEKVPTGEEEINETKTLVVAPEEKEKLPVTKPSPKKPESKPEVRSDILYAQPTNNGFQLVDNTPKVVYKIKKSGTADTYFVEGKQAIIYKSGSDWILEYYENDTLIKEVLTIKF